MTGPDRADGPGGPAGPGGPDGRDETTAERADRMWLDILQELRVMQTGVQLTAGFLLTLPFQSRFDLLDRYQVALYLALVVVALATTAVVTTPVAVHHRLSGRRVKDRLVATAHHFVGLGLGGVALLVVGIATFVFDVVVGRAAGLAAGGCALVVAAVLMVVLPRRWAVPRR